MKQLSLIIPTLREANNLKLLIPQVGKLLKKYLRQNYEILIVDDDSQDGTDKIVRELKKQYVLRLIVRKTEKGLSSAVIQGFRLSRGKYLAVMDADLSHPASVLPAIIQKMKKGYDLILPSRYIKGGGCEKWPLPRKVISLVATWFAHGLTKVKDPMSGFFCIKKDVVRGVELNSIGYKILLEILVKGKYDRENYIEIPYMFRNRHLGSSKLTGKIYKDYLIQLSQLNRYKRKIKSAGKKL